MSANGDFEVVWNNYYSESHSVPQGVFARHFDRRGRPTQAAEIRLDSFGDSDVSGSRVVALPSAGYFVAWFGSRGLIGRFLDAAGRPRSPVLPLARNGDPVALVVVSDTLIVAWEEGYYPRSLRAQRFDLTGHALGKPMLLTRQGILGAAGLAPLADAFVAAWQQWTGESWIITAQRFSLEGKPLGDALRVNERRLDGLFGVRVAGDGNDRFAVAWTTTVERSDPQSGHRVFDDETRARLFDSQGATGPETHPNQLRTGNQQATGLAMNSRGLTLIAWDSDRNSVTTSRDVTGRFVEPAGQPASKAFPLSQNLAGVDFCPAAATSGDDAWVVAWLKGGTGVFARRMAFEAEPTATD